MLGEPQKRSNKYATRAISKEEFASSYGVTRKTIIMWIRRAVGLDVKIHKGKYWKPWEVKAMIEYFGWPDESLL